MGFGPPRVTRTPRDTYPTELTPDTGLSHWWALPLALPRTPRLGGDRLGFFYGRLGGLGVGVAPLRRSHIAYASPTVAPKTTNPNNSNSSLVPGLSSSPTVYLGTRLATATHLATGKVWS